MPRPKRDVIKDPAILPQRDFALGTAVKIIEYRLRNSLPRNGTEVFDANHPRRGY
jgi:hypothetical protein